MTANEVLDELKSLGTEQTKKTWMRHGAEEPVFGVKVEDMKKVQKRIKMDYKLALEVYDSGVADAMYFAGLIADDMKMTKKDLQKWADNAAWGMVAEFTVPWVASGSPHGRAMALKWIESKKEGLASTGWQTYSSLVAITEDTDLDLAEIKKLLERVAKTIHEQPNRVKYVMNGFVIAVGAYVKPLSKLALDTAKSIGKVSVELVGACKIPFAPDQIMKMQKRGTLGKKRKSAKC